MSKMSNRGRGAAVSLLVAFMATSCYYYFTPPPPPPPPPPPTTTLPPPPPPSPTVVGDFDGDGVADLVWVDAMTGAWWKVGDTEPFFVPATVPFPATESDPYNDLLIPGDYDGDGSWEPAYLADQNTWVTAGAAGTITFEVPADFSADHLVPVPGDYDGDGRTDPAWYRSTDATWFIHGMAPIQFGTGEAAFPPEGIGADVPVPADYDGDGTTDIATFSPLTATWNIRGEAPFPFGEPGGLPAPADFDGDGRDEPASYSQATTTWHIAGQTPIQVTASDDAIPVPGRYQPGPAERWLFDQASSALIRPDGTVAATLPLFGTPALLPPYRIIHLVTMRFINLSWHDCLADSESGSCEMFQ
jgi:hypothetical protein